MCPGGRCFSDVQNINIGCASKLGRRVSCVLSGADASRATLDTLVVFDESQSVDTQGAAYQDGSAGWRDAGMPLPEGVSYQPAGQNARAADEQWYRLRPCAGVSDVVRVLWCNQSSSAGYNPATFPPSLRAGECDVSARGTAWDPATGPGTASSELQNSLSVDASGGLLSDGTTMGFAENFWMLQAGDTKAPLSPGSLCFQGLSNFNTEDNTYAGANESPVNLRLVAVMKDAVDSHADLSGGVQTWTARSKSNAGQGAFSVAVTSVRQSVVPSSAASLWSGGKDVDQGTHAVQYVEERNDVARPEVSHPHTWAEIEALVPGTLTPDADCGGSNRSDVLCADTVRWQEATDFHDQHIGRVKVSGYFQKTCGASKMPPTSWTPAGGLFDVYVQYADDHPLHGDASPGNGFAAHDGAGYRVSDSYQVNCTSSGSPGCVADLLSQQFTGSDHGSQLAPGAAGGSVCSVIYDDGLTSPQISALRSTACHIRDAYDVVGHDGRTWSDTVLHRVLANKCHRDNNDVFTCPDGALDARLLASNLRFRLPEKWSNCVRFKFEITVSNDDRGRPSYTFLTGAGGDYGSPVATLYVEPQPRAETPVMWVDPDLANSPVCLGNPGAACDGVRGKVGATDATYQGVSPDTSIAGSGAMSRLSVIAGYQAQVRIKAASAATDVRAEWVEVPSPAVNGPEYGWDSLRDQYKVSGERVYLTVQSRLPAVVSGKPAQQFCLWLCPLSTSDGQGCSKNDLVRVRPLPSGLDFTQSNVNCVPCTGDETDGCYEHGVADDGTVLKCEDLYGRDSTLIGCPAQSDSTPYHNPGASYSIHCSRTGHCPELRNLFVSVSPVCVGEGADLCVAVPVEPSRRRRPRVRTVEPRRLAGRRRVPKDASQHERASAALGVAGERGTGVRGHDGVRRRRGGRAVPDRAVRVPAPAQSERDGRAVRAPAAHPVTPGA